MQYGSDGVFGGSVEVVAFAELDSVARHAETVYNVEVKFDATRLRRNMTNTSLRESTLYAEPLSVIPYDTIVSPKSQLTDPVSCQRRWCLIE